MRIDARGCGDEYTQPNVAQSKSQSLMSIVHFGTMHGVGSSAGESNPLSKFNGHRLPSRMSSGRLAETSWGPRALT